MKAYTQKSCTELKKEQQRVGSYATPSSHAFVHISGGHDSHTRTHQSSTQRFTYHCSANSASVSTTLLVPTHPTEMHYTLKYTLLHSVPEHTSRTSVAHFSSHTYIHPNLSPHSSPISHYHCCSLSCTLAQHSPLQEKHVNSLLIAFSTCCNSLVLTVETCE